MPTNLPTLKRYVFDWSAFKTGLRTSAALLIGNSFFILTNIIGPGTTVAHITGLVLFVVGVTMLSLFSFQKG